MSSVLPDPAALVRLTQLSDIVTWANLAQPVWEAFNRKIGSCPTIRILSQAPADVIATAIKDLRIDLLDADGHVVGNRELTVVESIQVGLVWRVARQCFGIPDIDILAPGALQLISAPLPILGGPTGPSPVGSRGSLGIQKVKVSQIADQLDDTELEIATKDQLDEAFSNYRRVMGADPPKESEPSPEQITVFMNKVVTRGGSPYADFSVLTPFARRIQKTLKAKGWLLQEDGSWKQAEVAGPPTYEAWSACFDVYRTLLLMMMHTPNAAGDRKPVITWACLDEYFRNISNLNRQYPECWPLILQADDRCRSDHLERTRRTLTRAMAEGRLPMALHFDPEQPWVGVFTQVSRDIAFWNQEVVVPAQNFIARGGAGRLMSKMVAEEMDLTDGAKEALGRSKGSQRPFGEGESKGARKRRREREAKEENKRLKEERRSWPSGGGGSGSKGSGKKGNHPIKTNGLFVTDREGNQLCFLFAKGKAGACADPCQNHRTHACQHCLGQHPNYQCPKQKGFAAGGKSEGGK